MQDPWRDMKAEYKLQGGPGKLWLEEIGRLAQQTINKKIRDHLPPSIFGFPSWDKDDLVQLVLIDRLLGRNQAQYVLDTADSIDEARKILRNEINFVLSDHRVPNQVDNVWGNLEPRLVELGWHSGELISSSETDLHDQIVRLILSQKRLRNRGSERLSPLFAGSVLGDLATQILELGPSLPASLIRRALRAALTIISPALTLTTILPWKSNDHEGSSEGSFEDSSGVQQHSYAHSEENLRMERAQHGSRRYELARDICEKLNPDTLEIIFQKAQGANQSEIGAVLGLTRQTSRYRIEEAQQQLFDQFQVLELDIEESREVLSAMLDILGVQLSEVSS
jgi:hypothetical protein